MCKLCIVLDSERAIPMKSTSSCLKLVFVTCKCTRTGCLVIIEAILIENSKFEDDMSLWLKLKSLTVMFLFIASMMFLVAWLENLQWEKLSSRICSDSIMYRPKILLDYWFREQPARLRLFRYVIKLKACITFIKWSGYVVDPIKFRYWIYSGIRRFNFFIVFPQPSLIKL